MHGMTYGIAEERPPEFNSKHAPAHSTAIPMYDVDDTIAGVASAPGGAIRGVIRLSGPGVIDTLAACFEPAAEPLDQVARPRVVPGRLQLASPLPTLPGDLFFWPDLRSYTRQPSAEFHTVGSPPLLEAALATFCRWGARLAQPGEFTMRAFLAGRLDLAQAEAVLGVIDAESNQQLQVALSQLAGGLSRPLSRLRTTLLELLAHLEAGLDFVEEDIEFIAAEELVAELRSARASVQDLADQLIDRGQHEGDTRVALIGWPNVGKSSLFNALLDSPSAIVSEVAGTTRDYLSARFRLDELEFVLVDTAGVEAAQQGITACAQQMSASQADQANLHLFCLDATRPMNDWERARVAALNDDHTIVVLTKCDQPRRTDLPSPAVETSSHGQLGLDALKQAIRRHHTRRPQGGTAVPTTAARCRASLQAAATALATALEVADAGAGEELVAAEIRQALDELGTVVGTVYTDDILDRIFSRFCIGK